jgi:hypothetical protein
VRHQIAAFSVALAVACVAFVQPAAQRGAPQGGAAVDGRPDLRGAWRAPRLYNSNILEEHPSGFGIQPGRSVVIDPPDGIIPYQPWALAQRNENRKSENAYLDNEGRCISSGMPRIMLFSFEIEYAANDILLLFDYVHTTRVIHMDRRTHLPSNIRLWMGDSIGRWEGDTLVVDSTNFNGQFWFALGGDFATDALHIVERFRLSDPKTLQWEATLTDPKAYTRPWTMRWNEPYKLDSPGEMSEQACHEGNVDLPLLKRAYDQHHAKLAAGAAPARAVPTVTPKGPGRLTGNWVMTEAIGGGGNNGMLLHSQIAIDHTANQLEFLGTTSRQEPTYGMFRIDGTEIQMDGGPGITQTGRVSMEGDKVVLAMKRSFSSPIGETVVEVREAFSLNGDSLVMERTENVGGQTSNGKATYRRVP